MESEERRTRYDVIVTARLTKRAKVMFLQVFVILSPTRGGGVTPNASWDRSHGHRGGECTTPPRTRSQHLPLDNTSLPPGQHLPPPPGPGHNTSLPPSWTTPPSLRPWTTPPSLPPPPSGQHPPGLCTGRQYTSYWNAFLFSVALLNFYGEKLKC